MHFNCKNGEEISALRCGASPLSWKQFDMQIIWYRKRRPRRLFIDVLLVHERRPQDISKSKITRFLKNAENVNGKRGIESAKRFSESHLPDFVTCAEDGEGNLNSVYRMSRNISNCSDSLQVYIRLHIAKCIVCCLHLIISKILQSLSF